MRYSKAKIIVITIVVVLSIGLLVFGVIKGIDYSKQVSNIGEDDTKLAANVSKKEETKKEKKEEVKTTTKKETATKKETKSETKTETKKEEKKEIKTKQNKETTKKIVKVQDSKPYLKKYAGVYDLIEYDNGKKKYTEKEIEKLSKKGSSTELRLEKDGVAIISALDVSKVYLYTDGFLNDGVNEIPFTYSNQKLKVTVDKVKLVFQKK